MVTTTKPLTVYKASAGSGKTFTLAVEYIKLVVRSPQAYRKILAVTFTNKATEEMKMRILSQLYGIWHHLPESQDYADAVQKALDVSPDYVSSQAGIALNNLLHNYSYFRVETIDSFFQSVLRNLARELDLTANLRIGLNDYQVEEMAVDQLIENLSKQDVMLQWILKYIMENIEDDRSWNVIGQIKQFGKTIFRDYYKQKSKELYRAIGQKDFMEHYHALLRKIRTDAQNEMTGIGKMFFTELESVGLTIDDLSYGKGGVAGLFLKLQNGVFDESILGKRVTDCVGVPEKWCKKSHPRREEIYMLADGVLGRLLRLAIDEQPRQWKLYKSADLTLRHLSQLRLLDSIERQVRQMNDEANRFLLSDTQRLLHELIEGSDTPFLYEKIGTQLEHIMIDEFQDTSTVQWQNFKVLLQETMSHEQTENLIVGDVKQSIYRWRSGDWRLLANIGKEFPQPETQLDVCTLDTNYRSSRNVVEFNNSFFMKAAQLENVLAYDDVEQKVQGKRPLHGHVKVTLLSGDDYEQQTLDSIVAQVSQLLSQGVPSTKIAILVRTNSQIPLIANYFMEQMPEVRIVSDEAFRLDASLAVQIIIQSIRLLTHPDDHIARAFLAKVYSGEPLHSTTPSDLLPEELTTHADELLRLPLYELCERLYGIFQLQESKGQTAYLCAFYDQVVAYAAEQPADLQAFLTEWDDTICSKTIQCPEIEGVRLISIHKSKGLEFPYVVIPFCDWKLEHNDILWCSPQEKPFSLLPIVPIDYSQKGMTGTVYQRDYEEEHQQNTVDNLNLLYVAFTRAINGIYVMGRRGSKSRRSALIEQVLPEIVPLLKGATLLGGQDESTPLLFEFGEMSGEPVDCGDSNNNAPSPNVFLQKSTPIHPTIEVFKQKVEFRQSNRSRQFAIAVDEKEQQQQDQYIQMGKILHEVFSTIRTTADVDDALRRMEFEGVIYNESLTRDHIASLIRKRLANPRVAEWFSPRWTLYNECSILVVDPVSQNVFSRRPDRVMTDGKRTIVVDFKFGRPSNEYHNQVREYMRLLAQMGHGNLQGFLWYVYSNEIEEVK